MNGTIIKIKRIYRNDVKKTVIYTQENDDIAKAIEHGNIITDFLPRPEMLTRKIEKKTIDTGKIGARRRSFADCVL